MVSPAEMCGRTVMPLPLRSWKAPLSESLVARRCQSCRHPTGQQAHGENDMGKDPSKGMIYTREYINLNIKTALHQCQCITVAIAIAFANANAIQLPPPTCVFANNHNVLSFASTGLDAGYRLDHRAPDTDSCVWFLNLQGFKPIEFVNIGRDPG